MYYFFTITKYFIIKSDFFVSLLMFEASYSRICYIKKPFLILNIEIFIYVLAASVLRMLFNTWEVKILPETDKLVLRHYLNKQREYGTARPTDLWKSFEKFVSISVEKASIEEVMDTWTNQPGYPVVNATLNNNILTLTQVISYSFILCRYFFIFGLKILQPNLILLF